MKIQFHILSLFPETIDSYVASSVLGRAIRKKLISVKTYQLRRWGNGKHETVDESPFGGGPGMVLKIQPIYDAVRFLKSKIKGQKSKVILFSTRGKKFDAKTAKRLSKYRHLILICGRYEGVDERVARYIADEEISIGDFVLLGGEIPAMIVVDAVSRMIPGVLGKAESLEEIKGSYPVYTRPEVFLPSKKQSKKSDAWNVPQVLLSGDHKKIETWRKEHGRP